MSDSVGKVSLDLELESDLNQQFNSVAKQTGGKFAQAIRQSFKGILNGFKGAAKADIKPPDVDTDAVKAQINSLNEVLDNTNAKIEIQQRKLAELRQSYESAFSEDRKNKLMEKIVNTEGALIRLTQTSDKTAQKIWKLEDSLRHNADEANKAKKSWAALLAGLFGFGVGANKANKALSQNSKNLKNTTNEAKKTDAAVKKAGSSANVMGNQFTAAFSRIAKQVFVFAMMYKAIRGFQNYLGGSLRTNEQFVKSLNAIKTNLAVAFAPIYQAILPAINALMSAIAKITAYIAAFISALFGKTYKQSYDAAKGIETARKSMEGYGKASKKAAKDAQGALMGFDEVNTLDLSAKEDTDSGGGGGFEMQVPEMDIDAIQAQMDDLAHGVQQTFDNIAASVKNTMGSAWEAVKTGWSVAVNTFGPSFQKAWGHIAPEIEKWKGSFKKMFDDIKTLGEPIANWVQTGLVPVWQKGIEQAGKVWAGLSDSVRSVVDSLWSAVFPIIDKFVKEGLPRITEFISGAQDGFMSLFDIAKKVFDDIWRDAIDPAMKLVSKIIQDSLDIVFKWWDEWGSKLNKSLTDALAKVKEIWTNLWESFLKPFITDALNTLSQLWDKHLKGLIKEILDFVAKLTKAASDIFSKFIAPIVNWLIKTFGPTFSDIFGTVVRIVGTAVGAISDVVKGIIKALGGVIDFIAGVFTGDWKRAWEGIKTFFSGIWDAIVGLLKGAVNIIIEAFNFLIRQLNKIKVDIPDWVPGMGGKSFGINIPQLPKLAKGGLVHGPTLAMVGDNRGASVDPEVVSPLSKLQEMLGQSNQGIIEVLLLILSAVQQNNNQDSGTTELQIDGTTIARLLLPHLNQEQQRIGGSTIQMV